MDDTTGTDRAILPAFSKRKRTMVKNRKLVAMGLFLAAIGTSLFLTQPKPVDYYEVKTEIQSAELPRSVTLTPSRQNDRQVDSSLEVTPSLDIPASNETTDTAPRTKFEPPVSLEEQVPRFETKRVDSNSIADLPNRIVDPNRSEISSFRPAHSQHTKGHLVNQFYSESEARSFIPRQPSFRPTSVVPKERFASLDPEAGIDSLQSTSQQPTPAEKSETQFQPTFQNNTPEKIELELPGDETKSVEDHNQLPIQDRRSIFEETEPQNDLATPDKSEMDSSMNPESDTINRSELAPRADEVGLELPVASLQPTQKAAPHPEGSDRQLPAPAMFKSVHHIEYGKSLARRGSAYAARDEFIQALRLLAIAKDNQSQSRQFTAAFRQAMNTVREAEDFVTATDPIGRESLEFIIDSHKSSLLTSSEIKKVGAIGAMQRYLNHAYQLLSWSAGKNPAAAEALFSLGKLNSELSKQSQGNNLSIAKSILFHRSALACNPNHYHCANELGALMAKTGQLREARELFKQSLRVKQHPITWKNLAAVHAKLGEHHLAQLASREYTLSLNQQLPVENQSIHWIDSAEFNQINNNTPAKIARSPEKPVETTKQNGFSIWPKKSAESGKKPFKLFR